MMRRILELNVFNAVFVDCTASADVAAHYRALLEHHVHVVTANKVAASGPYEDYAALKDTARRRGVKLLFETNVGAGLPIIGTIGDLIASGDRIKSIEAVLSGNAQLRVQHALGRGAAFRSRAFGTGQRL